MNEESLDAASGSPAQQGWYADPSGAPLERYWDGEAWTDQTRAYPAPAGGVNPSVTPNTPDRPGSRSLRLVITVVAIAFIVGGAALAIKGLIPSCPSGSIPGLVTECAPRSGTNLVGEALYDIRPGFGVDKQANPTLIVIGLLLAALGAGGLFWSRSMAKSAVPGNQPK